MLHVFVVEVLEELFVAASVGAYSRVDDLSEEVETSPLWPPLAASCSEGVDWAPGAVFASDSSCFRSPELEEACGAPVLLFGASNIESCLLEWPLSERLGSPALKNSLESEASSPPTIVLVLADLESWSFRIIFPPR